MISSLFFMRRGLLALGLAAALCRGGSVEAAGTEPPRREISMSPGEQKILPGEGVDAVSPGTPGVVDVRVTADQKQVIIVALASGTTTLVLMMKNGTRVDYSISVSRIHARRNIRLDVYIVQIERHRGLQLGILWPGSLGATISAQAAVDQTLRYTGQANVVSQVIPQIDFAREKGWAKVMDQARLVAANGEEGNYSSGGELNIRITSGFAAELKQIDFGTNITSRVSYDDVTGRIDGHIKVDVSKITTTSAEGIPNLSRLVLETAVNLEVGQSLALAGLFADDEADTMNGLPLFSEIPIIGYLFGSRGTRQKHNENVVFIVPTLVNAVGLEQRDRVAEAFKAFKNYEGEDAEGEPALRKVQQDVSVRPRVPRPESVGP